MSATAPRILVADDQPDVLEALKLLLKGEGYDVQTATSPRAVLTALDARDFDALLIDMNYTRDTTSGAEGLDLLTRLQALEMPPPVVVMTAWASIDGAVEAMRRGARDFIEKPWDNRRLLATLRTQVELGRALRRSQQLERENRALRREGLPELIAESPAMQPVLKVMERIGPSDANVLILGEHGTGKEVVARWLHAASGRAERPLVAVNLGGIPDGLFESELFGHVKGAFTDAKVDRVGRFELAEGGTLFLDEIANLPLPQQAKLLRVLETGEFERVGSSKTQRVSVRVISATNADIPAEAAAGRFRQDLLFRLNTVEVRLPPLRERPEAVGLSRSALYRRLKQHGFGASPQEPEARAPGPVARAPDGRAWAGARVRAALEWRFRAAHPVDPHHGRRGRVARARRDAARARDPPAADDLEHARRAAGAGFLDARPRVESGRRARPVAARAERPWRRLARPAAGGAGRCGAARSVRRASRTSCWCWRT